MTLPTDAASAPAAIAAPPPATAAAPEILVVHDIGDPVASQSPPVVARITVIADPGWWADELTTFLSAEGFAVALDPQGGTAFDHRSRSADAAIVDLRLAARSAAAVCVAWRRRTNAPILAVAESREEATVLAAFAAGADQVVARDVTSRQMVAHLRSLLRRVPRRRVEPTASAVTSVQLGNDGRSALVLGRAVRLTEEEFQMLALLLDRAGRVVTRAELAGAIRYASGSARAVDFFVRRLREKLEAIDGLRRIVVVRGVGFRFDADVDVVVTDARPAEAATGEDPG